MPRLPKTATPVKVTYINSPKIEEVEQPKKIPYKYSKQSRPIREPIKQDVVNIKPRSQHQKDYLDKLADDTKSILFAIGPAGSGKSAVAMMYAIKLLKESRIKRIIITRPTVAVGDEDLGFLPGGLTEKLSPWCRPLLDVISEYYSKSEIDYMLREGILEIAPLGMMRGRTFSDAFIIADEVQNANITATKMLMTRLAYNSKMVITGDLSQADHGIENGLYDVIDKISKYKLKNPDKKSHIDMIIFDHADIVRHPVVIEVLDIYGENDEF
jgi:phosphate starvation-inducible PhoH-like protein